MSVNVNTTTNTVTIQDANKNITIVDNENANIVNVPQPITNIVQVATPGPQGPQGPAGSGGGGTVDTGSLVTTSSFNAFTSSINTFTSSYNTGSFSGSFTGSLNGTASWAQSASQAISSSYALTASYALNGGVTSINVAGTGLSINQTTGAVIITGTGGGGGGNTATGSYGSFYHTGSQTAVSATAIYSMSLSTTDISNGVYVSGSNRTRIYVTNAGVYDFQFSAQFRNTDTSNEQHVAVWIRKNNISSANDVVDSNSFISVPKAKGGNPGEIIAAWNFFQQLAAEDFIELLWHAETGGVITLETIAAGTNPVHPRTPSLILTANRVDQFLSNTGSFTGSFTGVFTGSLLGTAATASYYQETDPIFVAKSASLATTGSNNFNGNQTITGSLSQGLAGNIATGPGSHAEGSITKAIGDYSHAEGDNTQATGNYSHAEGQDTMTLVSAEYSHVEGNNTIASANHQHVQGQWNVTSSIPAAFIVGNGTDDGNRSNLIYAHDSTVEITGSLNVSGGITGSLFGTASWAESASNALYITGSIFDSNNLVLSASHANQADNADLAYSSTTVFINNGTTGISAFVVANSPGSNNSLYGDLSSTYLNADSTITAPGFTGSLEGTASWALNNTFSFSDDSSTINSININTETFSIFGTTDQIVTTGGNNHITISFPTDVVFPRHVTVQGDLTVDGQTTFTGRVTIVTSSNLTVDARYIGISAKTDVPLDSGIIVVTASGSTPPSASGYALYLDSLTSPRWALSSSVNLSSSGITPDEYLVSVKTTGSILSSSAPAPTYGGSSYGGGNMIIDNNNDIWIYVQ